MNVATTRAKTATANPALPPESSGFSPTPGNQEAQFFHYHAYGLKIRASLPLPEFIPASEFFPAAAGSDVAIHDVVISVNRQRSIDDYVPPEAIAQPLALHLTKEEAVVFLQEAGVFLLRGGGEIIVIPAPDASEQRIRLALTGTIMAILLYQRGAFILHGSVVNLHGRAVAFLGNSGEGKSSLAAALHAQGHPIVADDVAALTLDSRTLKGQMLEKGAIAVTPAFPQLKIYPEVADILGYDPAALYPLHPHLSKRGYRLPDNFPQTPLPLQQIYILSSGPHLSIDPLKPQVAIMELARHSQLATLSEMGEAFQFRQCATLVKACPVHRLQRPRNLALLSEVAGWVEKQVVAEQSPAATLT